MDALRGAEFARLDEQGHVYLDHTGAALAPASLVHEHLQLLSTAVLGNPHSSNPASRHATALVDDARAAVLAFFGADPLKHDVVFTSNATAAARLVAEAFPFRRASTLALLADNHNSILGLRCAARRAGARVEVLPLTDALRAAPDAPARLARAAPRRASALFAYPLQSNFSGARHGPALAAAARAAGYYVLADVAAAAPTARIDLAALAADFACVSFYKIAGFPTGVGALIARKDALAALRRPWFAGGAVRYVSVGAGVHWLLDGAPGFEDGTVDFQMIPAVAAGLRFMQALGMDNVERHVRGLTARMLDGLLTMRRAGGAAAIALYGPRDMEARGGTLNFNVLRRDGRVVDARRVERAANARNISLRIGCFCNPGAAERAFGRDSEALLRCIRPMGDNVTAEAVSQCFGWDYPGSVRVSLGISSVERDVTAFLEFLQGFILGLDEEETAPVKVVGMEQWDEGEGTLPDRPEQGKDADAVQGKGPRNRLLSGWGHGAGRKAMSLLVGRERPGVAS